MPKEDIKILNVIADSMKELLGDYANMVLRGTVGLVVDTRGKIVKNEASLKNAISALVVKYENVIGNSATIKIADSLTPYIKKNKKLKTYLPKSVLDAMGQIIDVNQSLGRWYKLKAVQH
jgi:hypothetical protein